MSGKYFSEENIGILEIKKKDLEVKKLEIIKEIYTELARELGIPFSFYNLDFIRKEFIEYMELIDKICDIDSDANEIDSLYDVVKKAKDSKNLEENTCYFLRQKAFNLYRIKETFTDIELALELPSKIDIDEYVANETEKLISLAKKKESEKPTDLSSFQMLIDFKVDKTLEPYTKLLCFIEGLPFSLDPRDPRYLSLTNNSMILGKDTERFNHYKVLDETGTGLDLIREMETWSDTVIASIQMRRFLLFQQYLEGDFDGIKSNIEELGEYKRVTTDCDCILSIAEKVSEESDAEKRKRMLAKFYQDMDSKYGNMYGFKSDITMFMDVYLDPERKIGNQFPKIGVPTRTVLEEAYLKVEKTDFPDSIMNDVYGITLATANTLVKNEDN